MEKIDTQKTIESIEISTGVKLELCDYFTGVKTYQGKKYFNVILNEKISESKDYTKLQRYADKYKIISIEPNGIRRVSIFIN